MVDATVVWDALPRPDPFINEELIPAPARNAAGRGLSA